MDDQARAWGNGLMGVIIFAGSLPATRVAVAQFDPLFLTGARACIAAVLAALLLLTLRAPRPGRADLLPLAVTSLGVVVGFPLFTALALQHVSSAHSIVFVGLLPLCTALFGVLRAGERPRPVFWLFATLGSACVVVYALGGGLRSAPAGNLYMVLAVLVCGLAYAEGGRLARRLGGWQVICWALVLAAPLMALLTAARWPASLATVTGPAWLGLAYVSLFSMLIGFVFWYRGLALGGIAAVGQLQLLQPFFGLGLAALLLHETVSGAMLAATIGAVACVAGARRYAT